MTIPATINDFLNYTNPNSTEVLTTPISQIRRSFAGFNEVLDSETDVTLTNPCAEMQKISFSGSGFKLILPPMNEADSIAAGSMPGIVVINSGSDDFDIVGTDGSTVVYSGLAADEILFIGLQQNDVSTNGSFITSLVSSTGSGFLTASANLSDVDDVETSRENLGVPHTSTYAGDPNTHVAGAVGDFCINTSSSNALYMCTTAGNAAAAAWTLQGGSSEGALLAVNNLDDVEDLQISRGNLQVPHTSVFAGDPTGNVGGLVGDFCINTSDSNALYICTTAGNAPDAVWELKGGVVSPIVAGAGIFSAVGPDCTATGDYSFAFGTAASESGATASGDGCFAFGELAVASGNNSIVMGQQATSVALYSVVLGANAYAFGEESSNAVAIGYGAQTHKGSCIAIGDSAYANGLYSIAIGFTATALYDGSFVITGSNSGISDSAPNQFVATFSGGGYFSGGNWVVLTAGKGLQVAEGSNAKQGTVTLVAGVGVVANTSVTANSRIFYCGQDTDVTGFLTITERTTGTGFTITSSILLDDGVVAYEIFEPGVQ